VKKSLIRMLYYLQLSASSRVGRVFRVNRHIIGHFGDESF